MKNNSGIYIIKFKDTNQYYIGQTNDLIRRRSEHFTRLKNNGYNERILEAYNNCKLENIEFNVLEYVNDLNKLNEREAYYISTYKNKYGNKVLNTQDGGNFNRDFVSAEKISNRVTEYWKNMSKEQKEFIINKRKEVYNNKTEEEKQERNRKISESTKEMWNNRSKEERELVKEKVKESLANMTNEEKESRWKHFDNTIKNRTKEEKAKVSKSARNNANIYWQTATPEQKAERARKIGEASRKRHEAVRLKKLQEQQLQGNKLF